MTINILGMKKPLIDSYNILGGLTSALDDDTATIWLHNSYIQLFSMFNGMDIFPEFIWEAHSYNHALFDLSIVPKTLLISKWNKSLKDLIIESVDLGYYLYFFVDRFFLSDSECYNKHHFRHNIFLYGYDLNKQVVYFADNLAGGKFIHSSESIDIIEHAYLALDADHDIISNICMYKIKSNVEDFIFDWLYVKNSFECYLYSVSSQYKTSNNMHGIDAVKNAVSHIRNDGKIDIRFSHVIWEHKKIMCSRIKYMLKNGYIKSENLLSRYNELENGALLCRNKAIKCSLKNSQDKILEIANDYDVIISKEIILLNDILKETQKLSNNL